MDELIKFLNERLNGAYDIEPEDSKGLADISIDKRIGIVLKININKKSEVDRLAGQILDYLELYNQLIIVLLGQVNQSAVIKVEKIAQKILKLYEGSGVLGENDKGIKVIVKPFTLQPLSTKEEISSLNDLKPQRYIEARFPGGGTARIPFITRAKQRAEEGVKYIVHVWGVSKISGKMIDAEDEFDNKADANYAANLARKNGLHAEVKKVIKTE